MTNQKQDENNKYKSLNTTYLENQQRAFCREVDEDVQNENLIKFWQKNKIYIISVITIILSYSIINNLYKNYKTKKSLEEAKTFETIISNNTISNSGKILELEKLTNTAKFGYKEIAYFNIYSLQMEEKKFEDAEKTLKTIINKTTNKDFKNLSIIKLASLNYPNKKTTMNEIKNLLSHIYKNEAFYNIAQFILGSIYIEEKDFTKAKSIFEKLTNSNIPEEIKAESKSMLQFINSNLSKIENNLKNEN